MLLILTGFTLILFTQSPTLVILFSGHASLFIPINLSFLTLITHLSITHLILLISAFSINLLNHVSLIRV